MKIKKIIAAVAAAAMALSMSVVNAFAIDLDAEYPGAWAASKSIPKSEFDAIGGDVKVVLTVETKAPLIGDGNFLAKPMNIDVSWDAVTDRLTSDTAIAKTDGFFVFDATQATNTVEFVVPADLIAEFGDNGLAFQVSDVIIKSAELSAGTPEGEIRRVTEDQSALIMQGQSYEEATGAAAPAEEAPAEEAPAADDGAATTPAATGNTSAAVMVSVMALAGVAAVATKKRK